MESLTFNGMSSIHLPERFYKGRKLQTLVENQTSYSVNSAELHIFETHEQADQILLQFDQPVLASMITGRKVMHLQNMESFEFLPGESLILPSDEIMCIDFPDATSETPTSCSAMAISQDKIAEVVNVMNESLPRADGEEWEFMDFNYRFTNDAGIYQLIQRLFFLFTENHSSRDIFVDFMLKELIIRVLRSNYQEQYANGLLQQTGDERIMDAIRFIRKHLDEPISIQKLSRVACMSESNFHRVFKDETGSSPVEFINNERIRRAAALLRQPGVKIKEVIHMCGFDSRSYFNRVFKQRYEMTPGAYQSGMSGPVVN